MFHMNQNLKIMLAVEPVDLRKSFNGLYMAARNELGEVPEDGALFVFANRSQPDQDPLFRQDRLLGLHQASGTRHLQLAKGVKQNKTATPA